MIIHVKAKENHLINEEAFLIPSQSSHDSVSVAFKTSEEWERYPVKKAFFSYRESPEIEVTLDENMTALVPEFVLARPGFKVRLRGENSKKEIFQSDVLTLSVVF